jgi:predicted amidohydrolase YtcJ
MVRHLFSNNYIMFDADMGAGALGSWGAALLAPYSDNNSTSGILTTDPEEMNFIVRKAWEAGWQVVRKFYQRSPPRC